MNKKMCIKRGEIWEKRGEKFTLTDLKKGCVKNTREN